MAGMTIFISIQTMAQSRRGSTKASRMAHIYGRILVLSLQAPSYQATYSVFRWWISMVSSPQLLQMNARSLIIGSRRWQS